jgi:drug/metabolite transporter (DMT)-like permease
VTLPAHQRNVALALGALMAVSSYALLAALEYMPVALCVITLYTYPLIVASFGWISGNEPFRVRFAVALIVAFAGLVLALDLPGAMPNVTGIALSLTAAVSISVLLIVSERVRDTNDSRPFTLHMLAACVITSIIAAPALGEFTLPTSARGWGGFIAAPVCYTFAIIFLFVAISKIGSLKTALILNLEPVSSVVLSYLLLSQSLKPLQLVGIALVIAAVISTEERKAATN